jgi:hypothetical protein
MMICNTVYYDDPSGGIHWVAVHNKYIYDSFARPTKQLKINNKWKITDQRAEQGILESNCGARCIAWLHACSVYSADEVARVI